ncbi:YlxR family protein, partial [Streptomyces halstedii]|uniref:YlxR family protein n=1 Tax=Streptomyces halstedii TaxID=1944 RepID=UPI003F4DFE47
MSGRTHARACPERTCVGCRERAAKSELLRTVVDEGDVLPDPRGTLPGRGAYVHPGCTACGTARSQAPPSSRSSRATPV